MSHLMRNFLTGKVSRATLLAGLLVGFAAFFSSVIGGILLYPGPFDWRKRVMSRAISPHHNPDAYWIPAVGIMVTALLFLPFAGYVTRRLHPITQRGARVAGVAFALGSLLLVGVGVPLPPGLERLHEFFARGSTAAIVVGALCCCGCAFQDRRRAATNPRVLGNRLAFFWMTLPLLLVGFGLTCGVLYLGRLAELEWALQARHALKPTMWWQLAFWEWVGVAAFFVFLFLSVRWLPERAQSVVTPYVPVIGVREPGLTGASTTGTINGVNHHVPANGDQVREPGLPARPAQRPAMTRLAPKAEPPATVA